MRNKWSKLQKETKDTKLLANSSGMESKMVMTDPAVFEEFVAAHPYAQIQGLTAELVQSHNSNNLGAETMK